jgi:hypothetical protein
MGVIIREDIIQASLHQEGGAGWTSPPGDAWANLVSWLFMTEHVCLFSESIENLCITMNLIIKKSIAVCL